MFDVPAFALMFPQDIYIARSRLEYNSVDDYLARKSSEL